LSRAAVIKGAEEGFTERLLISAMLKKW